MTAQFDIIVVGEDEASLCAAACAAKSGAQIGLVRRAKKSKATAIGAVSNIPNFVWRRLDLQDYGVTIEPVSARVTLFDEGAHVTTLQGARETRTALLDAGFEGGGVWEDFVSELTLLEDDGLSAETCSCASEAGAEILADLLSNIKALDRANRLSGSAVSLLDDYFNNSRLKDHVAAHALAPSGGGGAESGSARALVDYLHEDAWRVRVHSEQGPLREVLATICDASGVKSYAAPGLRFESRPKFKEVFLGKEERLKTRRIFFASPAAAAQAGVGKSARRGGAATATLRLKLSEGEDAPSAEDKKAIFQIIDDAKQLQTAHDDAVAGRLPASLPVEFEFDARGGLIARSAYCPAAFLEDGEWRGWTGQDRQVVEARMKERLTQRLPGLAPLIRKSKLEITGAATEEQTVVSDAFIIQPHQHNAVSAAVKLIDKVIASDR